MCFLSLYQIHNTNANFQEELVAKVVPSRIMSLAVNSSTAKLLVAVGDKWGNVGLWDVNDRQAITHGVRCFAVSC